MKRSVNLLVAWEPRWQNFREAVPWLFVHSQPKLPFEKRERRDESLARICSLGLHAALVLLLVAPHPAKVSLRYNTETTAQLEHFDISPYLPQMHDNSGAASGKEGRAGGGSSHRDRQVIRVARGDNDAHQVFEPPAVSMRHSQLPADLLMPSSPSPAPPTALLAKDHPEVSVPQFEAIAPAVQVPRSRVKVAIPEADVVAPPPEVAFNPKMKLPALKQEVIAPAPEVGPMQSRLKIPPVRVEVIPPAPIVPPDFRSQLKLPQAQVAPPSPDLRELARSGTKHLRVPSALVVPPGLEVGELRPGYSPHAGKALQALGGPRISAPKQSSSGGSGGGSGVLLSRNPGSEIGVPATGSAGSMSMSPGGSNPTGIGRSGSGSGAASGSGTGARIAGLGPGAAATGKGHGAGAEPFGISIGDGPGGAGEGTPGNIAGVSISGAGLGSPYSANARVGDRNRTMPAVTITGTSRSGGALNRYGTLKGGKVYTIYMETGSGPVVLEFSDGQDAGEFQSDLTPPEPLVTTPSPQLGRSPIVLSGRIDQNGLLQHVKILESKSKLATDQLLAAIRNWRFRPVLRGTVAVDVDVLLGFGITTAE